MDKNRAYTKKAFTFAELMISLVVISILSAILYPTIAQFTPNSNKPLFKAAYRTLTDIIHEIVSDSLTGEIPTAQHKDESITYPCPTKDNPAKTCTFKANSLCVLFCNKANILSGASDITYSNGDTLSNCEKDCGDNILTTSNGMRWYFGDYKMYKDPAPQNGTTEASAPDMEETFQIIVDVNASNNSLSQMIEGVAEADKTFVKDCTNTRNGKCGTFKFNNTKDPKKGIYTQIPNYSQTPPKPAQYSPENLKIQDTFEIYINKKGKVISMSPAGWANLEDEQSTQD